MTGCFEEDLTPDLRGVEEMFVPVDPPDAPEHQEDKQLVRQGGRAGPTKADLKNRRAREMRVARKRVQETIKGWAKTFSGEGGKPYYLAGEIVREEGWLERLPKRELCEAAKKSRPKRKKDE